MSDSIHCAPGLPAPPPLPEQCPNGEFNSEQIRELSTIIEKYGDAGDEVPSSKGCADITTRATIQIRGLPMEDAVAATERMMELGITSKQAGEPRAMRNRDLECFLLPILWPIKASLMLSAAGCCLTLAHCDAILPFLCAGMDNVRNITSSPIAGIDPHELMDPREVCREIQDMITDYGKGRKDLSNLPRKFNIAVSPSRDDWPHCHINDLAFQAIEHPESGEVVYNVWLGGMFSAPRNDVSLDGKMSVTYDQIVPFCEALLQIFRQVVLPCSYSPLLVVSAPAFRFLHPSIPSLNASPTSFFKC